MPGIFDNSNPPSGFGGILQGLGAALSPEFYNQQLQMRIYRNEYNAIRQQFPGMSDAEIYTRMQSPGGMENLFVAKPVPGFKTPSGAEAPGILQGNTLTPPGGMGFQTMGPGAGIQPQPTQQPAASVPQPQAPSPLNPMDQYDVTRRGAIAEAESRAKAAGGLQPGFPAALNKAHQTISALESIRDDPDLEKVTGRVAGGLPARYSVNPDLVNSIESANNLLLNDTLTATRNVSGRPINAGTLKEIRPFDLVKDRLGSADGLRSDINRAIKTIQDETDAAWIGSNSPPEYKPVWGKGQAQQAPTIPQVGEIRKGHKFLGGNPADPKSWQKQQTM